MTDVKVREVLEGAAGLYQQLVNSPVLEAGLQHYGTAVVGDVKVSQSVHVKDHAEVVWILRVTWLVRLYD